MSKDSKQPKQPGINPNSDYVGPDYPSVQEGEWAEGDLTYDELADWYGVFFPRWGDNYENRVKGDTLARVFTEWADERRLDPKQKRNLALLMTAQGQQEGAWKGAGTSTKNNPFNWGEWGTKTVKKFDSPEAGIRAYLDLIEKDYMPPSGNPLDLLNHPGSFVNYAGNRYAKDPNYEVANRDHVDHYLRGIQRGFGPYPPFPK